MIGEIPWSTKSGEEVEKLIAVYICKENPDAIRIRPSKGDHGIDLMDPSDPRKPVNVYQIKKFARNLTYSQKKQIKKSWQALITYARETGLNVKRWYLAMPLNPTSENINEICQLTQGSGIQFSLIGLDRINGWAAKYPDVQDYFLNGEQDTIYRRVAKFIELNPQVASLSDKSLYEQLITIRDYLNERDPNYKYFLKTLTKTESKKQEEHPSSAPEAILTNYYFSPQGEGIQIDVVPKYKAAPELAPFRFKASLTPENDEQSSYLSNFVDFGAPFKDIPGTLTNMSLQASDNLSTPLHQPVAISFNTAHQNKNKLTDQYFQVQGEKPFTFHGSITGTGRKGIHWGGTDDSKLLDIIENVQFTGDAFNKKSRISITFSLHLNKAKGLDISRVQKAVDFLATFYLRGKINILDSRQAQVTSSIFPKNEKKGKRLLLISNMLQDLRICEAAANQFIPCPDLTNLDADEAKSWHCAARILKHGWTKSEWTQLVYKPFNKEERIDLPRGCTIRQSLKIRCSSKTYPLGFYLTYLNIGSAQMQNDHITLKPQPENKWLINQLVQGADSRQINMVKLGPTLNEEQIETYLENS